MIYCPHCRKPSARTQGPCPHCGLELSKRKSPEKHVPKPAAKARPAAPPTPTPPKPTPNKPAPERSLDGNISLEAESYGESGSGLDLDTDDAPRAALSGLALQSLEPEAPVEMGALSPLGGDEMAVAQTAGFGRPKEGIVGAVKYWIVVLQRQKILKGELAEAELTHERLEAEKVKLLAELGRKAHEAGVKAGAVGELISKALLAQAELKGVEKQRLNRSTEHKTKVDSLNAAIELMEKKISPTKREEDELKGQRRDLMNERKGVETRLKRFQIDLRNMDELIRKRQEAYADLNKPKEERDKLLADITMFDKRCNGLNAQASALETELQTFDAPLADVEYRLKEVRDRMAPELKKIMALNKEIDEITRRFTEEDGQTAQKLGENQKIVLDAWASTGVQVIKDKLDEPDLEAGKKKGTAAMIAAEQAEDKKALLSRAIVSYDGEAVKKAQTVVAAVGGGLLLLIILLFVFL